MLRQSCQLSRYPEGSGSRSGSKPTAAVHLLPRCHTSVPEKGYFLQNCAIKNQGVCRKNTLRARCSKTLSGIPKKVGA